MNTLSNCQSDSQDSQGYMADWRMLQKDQLQELIAPRLVAKRRELVKWGAIMVHGTG